MIAPGTLPEVPGAYWGHARQVRPEWQHLRPGDQILMMPGSGFDVAEVQNGHYFTARAPDRTMSWCLAVESLDQHT